MTNTSCKPVVDSQPSFTSLGNILAEILLEVFTFYYIYQIYIQQKRPKPFIQRFEPLDLLVDNSEHEWGSWKHYVRNNVRIVKYCNFLNECITTLSNTNGTTTHTECVGIDTFLAISGQTRKNSSNWCLNTSVNNTSGQDISEPGIPELSGTMQVWCGEG